MAGYLVNPYREVYPIMRVSINHMPALRPLALDKMSDEELIELRDACREATCTKGHSPYWGMALKNVGRINKVLRARGYCISASGKTAYKPAS